MRRFLTTLSTHPAGTTPSIAPSAATAVDGVGAAVPADAISRLELSLAALYAFLRRRAAAVLDRAEQRGCVSDARRMLAALHEMNPHADDALAAVAGTQAGGLEGPPETLPRQASLQEFSGTL